MPGEVPVDAALWEGGHWNLRRLAGVSSIRGSLARDAALLFIAFSTLEAPIKAAFYSIGLGFLYYIPKFSLLLLVLLSPFAGNVRVRTLASYVMLLGGAIVGMSIFGDAQQVLFGLYVYVPFLFGVVFYRQVFAESSDKYIIILYVTCAAGVIVNYFVAFPWAATQIDLGSTTISAVKSWSAGGVSRIAGLSSASYEAATQIVVMYVFILARGSMKHKQLLFVLGFVAVVFTTTRGVIVAMAILPLLTYIHRRWSWSLLVTLLCAINIAMPLYAYNTSLTNVAIALPAPLRGAVGLVTLATMVERAQWMWPDGIHFVLTHGNAWVGAGLGGIGTALSRFFDPSIQFSSADSLLVYVFANFGLIGVLVVIWTALRNAWWNPISEVGGDQDRLLFVRYITVCVLLFGITGSPVERSVMCLFSGLGVGLGPSIRLRWRSA